MKHRFLLHSLNHTVLIVDISQFGINIEINPRTGNSQMVPALRFINWKEADDDTIESTRVALAKTGVAVMTVV